MRKILVIIACILSTGVAVHAQGVVQFQNTSSSLITTNLQGNSGSAHVGAFLVALYGGSATAAEGDLVQLGRQY